jgi:hypothetical protein
MKIRELVLSKSIRRAFLFVPVIFATSFAACSDLGATAGTPASVNFQSSVVGNKQSGEYITIGPRSYNSESKSFERAWPFGPEYNPQ